MNLHEHLKAYRTILPWQWLHGHIDGRLFMIVPEELTAWASLVQPLIIHASPADQAALTAALHRLCFLPAHSMLRMERKLGRRSNHDQTARLLMVHMLTMLQVTIALPVEYEGARYVCSISNPAEKPV